MATTQTPILDDFNRANETPLSKGGLWSGLAISLGDGLLNLSSNTAVGATGSVNNSAYWLQPLGPDQEVYFTPGASNDFRLYGRLTAPNTAVWNAYEFQFNIGGNTVTIRQMIQGSNNFTVFTSTMAALGLTTMAAGDRYMARVTGRATVWLEVYADFGNTGTWTRVVSTSDGPSAELQGAGRIGAFVFSNGVGFDNFGGGTILSTNYESLGRRPTPMMRGPDSDQIMRMQWGRVT